METYVGDEVFWGLGGTGAGKVTRRPHNDKPIRSDGARDQARIGHLAGLNDDVVSAVDDIDGLVRKVDLQIEIRIGLHEAVQAWHHESPKEREFDTQFSLRGSLCGSKLLLNFVDLREDCLAAIQEELSFLRQCHCAGVSVEQTYAMSLFKPRDRLPDGGWRQVQLLAGVCETAHFGGVHECAKGVETVHFDHLALRFPQDFVLRRFPYW